MGSRNWDPNKVLGISEEDIRAVEERRQMRSRIKAEWVQKSTNPYRGYGGNIFDPAVQRFYSMKVTGMENFRATPQTAVGGLLFLSAVLGLSYYNYSRDKKKEHLYRTGQIAYKDRHYKTMN